MDTCTNEGPPEQSAATQEQRERAEAREEQHEQIGLIRVRHKEIIRRLLAGQTSVEIAEDLDCTPQAIRGIRKRDDFQEMMGVLQERADEDAVQLRKRIKRRINEILPKIMDYYEGVITGAEDGDISHGDKIRVAESMLKKGGFPDTTKSELAVVQPTTVTGDDLREATERAYQAAEKAGLIKNVTASVEAGTA